MQYILQGGFTIPLSRVRQEVQQFVVQASEENESYIYLGNVRVDESNFWQKLPGGGLVCGDYADLSEIYIYSPMDAEATLEYNPL